MIKNREELAERFNAAIDALIDYKPYEVMKGFDYLSTPVITNQSPNEIIPMHWGLVPSWSDSKSIQQYTLNARIETLHEKPSFNRAVQNRCLILADGFYEWQWLTKSGSKKDKYLITRPKEAIFSMAGIYDEWITDSGDSYHSYSVVTTQANELMSGIHNTKQRMPVILAKEDEEKWLHSTDYKQFAYPYEVELVAKNLSADNSQLNLF